MLMNLLAAPDGFSSGDIDLHQILSVQLNQFRPDGIELAERRVASVWKKPRKKSLCVDSELFIVAHLNTKTRLC